MSRYADQNAEIVAQLTAITGIGQVYGTTKNPTDEKTWNDTFIKNNIVNSVFISRLQGPEQVEGSDAATDETSEIEVTRKVDTWQITLLYGFHDDENASLCSDYLVSQLVDAIEDKFRFLQDLNKKAFKSYPLSRSTNALFEFLGGKVLCHKAVWTLNVVSRIINPN